MTERSTAARVAAAGLAGAVAALFALALLRYFGSPSAAFVVLAALAAIAALIYVAWNTDPVYMVTAGILLSCFSGNWNYMGLPGSVAPDRMVLAAGLAAVLLRGPGARDRPAIRIEPVHWVLLVATLYALFSALAGGMLWDSDATFKLVDRFGFVPFLVFLVAPVVYRTERDRRILMAGLVIWGAYLGLTTLFETVGLNALVFPKYILDPNAGFHSGRGRGPFVEANSNGFALYVSAIAGVMAALSWRRPAAKAAATVVVLICAAGLLFTITRAVWIGSVFATGLVLLTVAELRRFVVPALACGAFLVGASLLFIPGLADEVKHREENDRTVWNRQDVGTAAQNMILARPLFGFGWERFRKDSAEYFQQSDTLPLTAGPTVAVHNAFLANTAELGLVGAGLWAFALGLAVVGALFTRGPPELRRWKIALGAVVLCWLVLANAVYPLAYPMIMLWLFAGLVWSGRYTTMQRSGMPAAAG